MVLRTAGFLMMATSCLASVSEAFDDPIVDSAVLFEEQNGIVAVEAEFFYKQSKTEKRAWYLTSHQSTPQAGVDPDGPHLDGASNNGYLEILPDTRKNHSQPLVPGENFSNRPTPPMAVLHYKVHFNTPGRYYVWARAYSSGSEDNGLHVGIDGKWPTTGHRLQWCDGKNSWRWESKQRTEQNHCGEPHLIYLDVTAGTHDITFAMREDGFEFDKWLMTTEKQFQRPDDAGPAVQVKQGRVPEPFPAKPSAPDKPPVKPAGDESENASRLISTRHTDQ